MSCIGPKIAGRTAGHQLTVLPNWLAREAEKRRCYRSLIETPDRISERPPRGGLSSFRRSTNRIDFSTPAAGIDPRRTSSAAGFQKAPQTDRARLAGCIRRLHSCVSIHLPGGDSLLVLENAQTALRISNAIAVVSLFFAESFLRVMPAFGRGQRAL